MHSLDFLSQSPKNFIFQKETNKTNFGGVLFLLYIIIMFFISLAYLLDYFMNDHYIIEYSQVLNTLSENKQNFTDNPETNPTRYFGITLTDFYGKKLSNKFLLINLDDGQTIYNNSVIFKKKISDIYLGIIYNCKDSNCKRSKEDLTYLTYKMNIIDSGYSFNHQNSVPTNDNLLLRSTHTFNFNTLVGRRLLWRVVKYKEVKGISRLFDKVIGNKNEYSCGYFDTPEVTILDNDDYLN